MIRLLPKKQAADDSHDVFRMQMRLLTRQHQIPLIVDDRLDVALAVDADGPDTQTPARGEDDFQLKLAQHVTACLRSTADRLPWRHSSLHVIEKKQITKSTLWPHNL